MFRATHFMMEESIEGSEYRMNSRRMVIISLFLSLLFVMGCGEISNEKKEEVNNSEEIITEEYYHGEYGRRIVYKSIGIFDSNRTLGFKSNVKNRYGCIRVELAPLFDDDNITRIEYHIEDGNGYFMDKNNFMIMEEEELEKRIDTLTQWEENGYHCAVEDQQGIFFTIYYKHDINLDSERELILKRNLIRKVTIVIDLKYKDGTEKQHRYAFDFPYSYNYTNVNIYELTKE